MGLPKKKGGEDSKSIRSGRYASVLCSQWFTFVLWRGYIVL